MIKNKANTIFCFDCDGVVLDSNKIKIEAMQSALFDCGFKNNEIMTCIDFFSRNFGLSRFVHVKHFLEKILCTDKKDKELIQSSILTNYSEIVSKKYKNSKFCKGFINYLEKLDAPCNIVSGSEQTELREVLKRKNIYLKLDNVLGSPISKKDNLISLKESYISDSTYIYFGDSIADLEAAQDAGYEFIGVLGYSMVADELKNRCIEENYKYINFFSDLK